MEVDAVVEMFRRSETLHQVLRIWEAVYRLHWIINYLLIPNRSTTNVRSERIHSAHGKKQKLQIAWLCTNINQLFQLKYTKLSNQCTKNWSVTIFLLDALAVIHSVKKVPGIDHSKSLLKEIVKNLFDANLAPLSSILTWNSSAIWYLVCSKCSMLSVYLFPKQLLTTQVKWLIW